MFVRMTKKKTDSGAGAGPTRERILAKAMKLFAERGYEGCTVQDIAAAVGIKAASLYAHYAGKEAIFAATLRYGLDEWAKTVDEGFAEAEGIRDLGTGAALIAARYIASMSASIAYRFWTRVYVFPPEPMARIGFGEAASLDKGFSGRLKAYCASRSGLGLKDKALGEFVSSLIHFMSGVMVDSMGVPPKAAEIKAGVALLCRGLMADKKGATR
jgi:AcrR family transcriptional regulator